MFMLLVHSEGRRIPATKHPLYKTWCGIIQRCENPKSHVYQWYGAKGVRICRRWRKSFWDFVKDVGPKPSPRHSLDRYPNNRGNYAPGNVRWATSTEQANNRTSKSKFSIAFERMLLVKGRK